MTDGAERYARRRERLRAAMVAGGIEAVLISHLIDVRWLTGFVGSYGLVLVTADDAVLASDPRYAGTIESTVSGIDVAIGRQMHGELITRLHSRAGRTLHVDAAHTSVAFHRQLSAVNSNVEVVAAELPLASLRVMKDSFEIEALREACRISDAALADVVSAGVRGKSERQLALTLERRMVDLGAEDIAFTSIVAAGENSAIPHHSPTERVIVGGDLLKIDFGARVDGYHADETRTFVVGEPAAWQVEIHAAVQRAQQAGVDALKPGVPVRDIDVLVRNVLREDGYLEYFTTGLGHGVGLLIHEDPFFAGSATGILAAGTPLTVEPGIYLPGRGGVRIEDTVLIGEHGAESLTKSPRELVVLG